MDKDRELGRIASTATKRRQAEEHARAILPEVRKAIAAVRLTDRGETLRSIADWLNAHDVKTQKGKVFRAQTVSRLLYNTETYMEEAASAEFARARAIIVFEAKRDGGRPDQAVIADLECERDRIIEAGRDLGRKLRLEDR